MKNGLTRWAGFLGAAGFNVLLAVALLQGLLSLNLSHKFVAESPCEQVVEEASESGESETDAD